jgi:hypothetical protein
MSGAAGNNDNGNISIGDDSIIIDINDMPLPKLKSIWDCDQINKVVVPGSDGTFVAGLMCGWCLGALAVADFIHSHLLPFSLAEDPKFLKILQIAKSLGAYKPPNQQSIGGKYLDALHLIIWREQMKTLLSEATTFGITIFGDGATIKSIALLNVLAAGVNNLFALLAIADCTDHLAKGGKKDASHISTIIKPLIANLEGEVDELQCKYMGIVDLVFFYGASRQLFGHGAEHVVSLFFKDVHDKVTEYMPKSFYSVVDICSCKLIYS